jgi:tetratricopeptide (TPR) repeat protein
MFMSTSGNTKGGAEYLHRALTRARESGDTWAVATALTALAHTAMEDGDYNLARHHAEESISWLPPNTSNYELAHVINVLGDVSRLEGKYEEAREHYERAIGLSTESGYTAFIPSHRHNLAWALHGLGDDARAVELFLLSIADFQGMDDQRGVGECLVGLGCAAPRPDIAVQMFAAGISLLERHGMALSSPNQRDYDHTMRYVRDALSEETWRSAWEEGAKLTPDEAVALIAAGAPVSRAG